VRNVTLYRHHAVLTDSSITGHLKYNTSALYCKPKNVHKNIQPGHEKYTFLYRLRVVSNFGDGDCGAGEIL